MAIASALLALILPTLILIAWHLERAERNDQIRAERASRAHEWRAWQDERRELLNRIKPETAQFSPVGEVAPAPRVPFDDDQAFHEAVDPMAMSKDELAEFDAFMDQRSRDLASDGSPA